MELKIKDSIGKVKDFNGKEVAFYNINELIEIIKNRQVPSPEYIFIYGNVVDGKAFQLVLDFNSISEQNVDINILKKTKYQKFLGDILVEKGFITPEQLNAALKIKESSNYSERLGEILVREGFVSSSRILEALNDQLGVK